MNSGILNGEPTPPGYDIYDGEAYAAPPRPHKSGHDALRRIIDASFTHEISWEDVQRRLGESIRVFTKLGVDEEALERVADPEHTDWVLWDGPSPPEVLSVEALIHERDKPRAVVFKDSPATRMPALIAEPAHQSGIDHLVGHLTHFHMGGDGQDEYLATRFQSLGIRQRIREGKLGQALYAPVMAGALVKHKNIRIGNHLTALETVAHFPLHAFSEEPVPELDKWTCDHTLVPIPYGDPESPPEKRSRFMRAIGGLVPGLQPHTRSGGFYRGWSNLQEQLKLLGLTMDDEPQYDSYPYDAESHFLLVIEKRGAPNQDDIAKLISLESFMQGWKHNLDEDPPLMKPAPLTKMLLRGSVYH